MDLRQLAAVVAVAENGTFSAAAAALHTVQSNVSTHIARLERELGVTLFDRAAGRLTEEGMTVVARARRVQAELDALVADVASLHEDVAGNVRMGIIGTTGRWLMPRLLGALDARHPRVRVAALEGNTTNLNPQLDTGTIDLAVVNLRTDDDPDLLVEPLVVEDLILVAPTGHPLADRTEIHVADLDDVELLLTPAGTGFRDDLQQAAEAAGVRLRPKVELDGLRLIASMSLEGYGASVLPASAVPMWLTGAWSRVPVVDLPGRRVGLARRRRGLPSAPARALTEVLRDVVAAAEGDPPGIHPTAVAGSGSS